MFRLLAALIGFLLFRWPGAIVGFLLGGIFDSMALNNKKGQTRRRTIFRQSGGSVSPADFELNLLSLASLVIRSDGNITQTELDFVRKYFVQAYGKERANATFRVFNNLSKKREISAQRIGGLLRQRMRYESRLQVIHFLFSIANSDGYVSEPELNEVRRIAGFLGIESPDFESIKAMFFQDPDSAYRILEIERTATNDEIKTAYRTMAKKYHPDRLQHMDEAYVKGAEEKFRKVQEAYEQLRKQREF